jgi:trehalose synthase
MQIEDGENGFLVSSVEQAAARIVQLLKDDRLRATMGEKARDSVRGRFLLTRLFEQYLDLFESFEPRFGLRGDRAHG